MLRLRKLERIKDFLLLEQEYIQNQEVLKPREEKEQVDANFGVYKKYKKIRSCESKRINPVRWS